MKLDELQPKHFFIAVVGVLAIFLVPGILYWSRIGPDSAKCIWGDAACSLTVTTYVLTLVTAMAFLAAFQAARYAFMTYRVGQNAFEVARETLKLERTAMLGVLRCRHPEHNFGIDVMILPTLKSEMRAPTDEEESYYYLMSYEFTSLGRIPIVDATVEIGLAFSRRDGSERAAESVRIPISLGNFKTDGDAHVRIWIPPELLDSVRVGWLKQTATQVHDNNPVVLEFYPLKPERPEFRGLVRYDRTGDLPVPAPVSLPGPRPTTPI